jgi:hypothetical protein
MAKEFGFDSWQRQKIFLVSTSSRSYLGPTQPPIQWALGSLSPDVKSMGVKLTSYLHLVPKLRMVELYLNVIVYSIVFTSAI